MAKSLHSMSKEEIDRLYENGAVLMFLDVPEGTEFGIDMKSWYTGDKFKGVKMIPAGIHYVHYSATSKYGDVAPRTGFIHYFRKAELLVIKYDKQNETIRTEEIDADEIERLRSNLKNMDRFLGAYPYEILEQWEKLTSHITEQLIEKLQPQTKQIRSALELVSPPHERRRSIPSSSDEADTASTSGNISTPSSSPTTQERPTTPQRRRAKKPGSMYYNEDDLLPDLKPVPGTELRFSQFPERSYPDGATPAEITQHSLDSTFVLEYLLKSQKNPIDLIGELQFAFVCFLIGHSLDAFEHWKRVANVICSCERAIEKYRVVYDLFLTTFQAQLDHVPEEFLADIVLNNNFVYLKLRELFYAIETSDMDGRLKQKADSFKCYLSRKFDWDFANLGVDDDDDAPVVVQL